MSSPAASTPNARPIRDLVCPELEEPLERDSTRPERRRSYRYRRNLSGEMIADGLEHPITCSDIGYGGVRVVTTDPVNVSPGDWVVVRIDVGAQPFQDRLNVLDVEHTPAGAALHLGL